MFHRGRLQTAAPIMLQVLIRAFKGQPALQKHTHIHITGVVHHRSSSQHTCTH